MKSTVSHRGRGVTRSAVGFVVALLVSWSWSVAHADGHADEVEYLRLEQIAQDVRIEVGYLRDQCTFGIQRVVEGESEAVEVARSDGPECSEREYRCNCSGSTDAGPDASVADGGYHCGPLDGGSDCEACYPGMREACTVTVECEHNDPCVPPGRYTYRSDCVEGGWVPVDEALAEIEVIDTGDPCLPTSDADADADADFDADTIGDSSPSSDADDDAGGTPIADVEDGCGGCSATLEPAASKGLVVLVFLMALVFGLSRRSSS